MFLTVAARRFRPWRVKPLNPVDAPRWRTGAPSGMRRDHSRGPVRSLVEAEHFGPSHPDVAKMLTVSCQVCRLTGCYALAERLQKRALNIQEKALGPDHLHVGVTLNNLALTYWHRGRYADAENCIASRHRIGTSLLCRKTNEARQDWPRSSVALRRICRGGETWLVE